MIHWGYPPVIGGVETHLSQLCPWFVREGHEVSLFTGSHKDEPRDEYTERGVHIVRRPMMDLNWLYERGFTNLSDEIARQIAAFLDVSRPDVIHAHNLHYFSELHAKAFEREAKLRNIPLVLTAHNMWDDAQNLEMTRDIAWDHIIAISHYINREILGCGIEPSRISMIHHGIDGTSFHQAQKEMALTKYPKLRGGKVVFHPARMGLAKGSSVILKAFRLVKERVPEAVLVLAGTKNVIDWGRSQEGEVAYILQLADIFGLKNDIVIDFFSHASIPPMYAAADVCVYPSIHAEPFGLVMLESMASGKPIVVTQSGGMPEIVAEGENGYVVEPRNHIALAERISQLLRNPEKARAIGARGLELFNERYTLAHMAEKMVALYQRVIADRANAQAKSLTPASYGISRT